MTQDEYFEEFKAELLAMYKLTRAKNMDYAGAEDAFKNFKLIGHLGAATVEQGFVVRMSDKLQRIANLISRPNMVADEKIEDTCRDLSIYCILFLTYLKSKDK
jgi:hypothetical protein